MNIVYRNWKKKKNQGQAMVEFMLALPILLFVIFGIVEFARLTYSWMAVQNSARFAIRYAVTGEFNEIYCVEAGSNLGVAWVNADVFGGDPQDCLIPDAYTGTDANDKERELIDLARLFSIRDSATGGGAGLWIEPAVGGDYEQYLLNHDPSYIGSADSEGYFHVTVCSNRNNNQFQVDYNNHVIPLCVDNVNSELMDDAGGPGDRVKVHVEHQHPIFLPLISNIWPTVALNAERDGIVEKFRTSRSLGVSGPILSAPTWTQTPTITDTPTITPTFTETPTPLPTSTPIPVQCNLIEVVTSFSGPYSGYYTNSVTIRNNNPVPIHLIRANQDWQKNVPNRYLYVAKFHNSGWRFINDTVPPTTWTPSFPIELPAGLQAQYVALYTPRFGPPLEGVHSVDLEFDDGCHKGVTIVEPTFTPTPTATNTPTPTITPTPDCSKYRLGNFSFLNYENIRAVFRNRDVVDANLVYLELNWDYAEQLGAANGYNDLNVDWFKWAGGFFPGHANGGYDDRSSSTSWSGSLPFNAGTNYRWDIDLENGWGGSGPLTGLVSNDFGVYADFDNGCNITRNAVPRGISTFTLTPTPTRTGTPTPVPPPTSTSLPTWTPWPTNTPRPTRTPTKTFTPSKTPTPSDTPVPSHTSWPTNTPHPTQTPWPSSTSPPPTSTPINTPADTSTPLPTNTPIPTWCNDC